MCTISLRIYIIEDLHVVILYVVSCIQNYCPRLWDIVDSGKGCRTGPPAANVAWRSGTTTLCRSWLYPQSQGLWIGYWGVVSGGRFFTYSTAQPRRWDLPPHPAMKYKGCPLFKHLNPSPPTKANPSPLIIIYCSWRILVKNGHMYGEPSQ